MASCTFCKVDSQKKLKKCVCGKASYCSKECQAKDWKTHRPSCPQITIRESPGKGRGLFATRRIKGGQIILEEYPLITLSNVGEMSLDEFKANHYPYIDKETKTKILQLNDPAENMKKLDTKTAEKLARKDPVMMFWKKSKSEEISKIFRIFTGNSIKICGEEHLYRDTTETGLFNKIHLINHACVPNTTWSWVMGDFQRQQVRAMMDIEKDEEILASYYNVPPVLYGSRKFRQQVLLEAGGFLCKCSECSLEGWDMEDNERMRAEIREIREKMEEINQLRSEGLLQRKSVKKAMKLSQQRVKLLQTLNIRTEFVVKMNRQRNNLQQISLLILDSGTSLLVL